MERPAKRLRIGLAGYDDKEDDELGLEPEEFEQLELSKDPGYQLEQGRAKAAYKLKSKFEHIFEKYEKDFTDVGDEIDLRTGEIVVDNGHLQSMRDARDDAASQAGRTEDGHSEADSVEEEERILHGGKIAPDGSLTAVIPRSLDYNGGQVPRLPSFMDSSSRLPSMMPFSRMPFAPFTPPRSFASFSIPSDPIESPWRAPELPSSAFSAAFKPQGLLGRGAPKTTIRKALPRPQIVDERQNEDAEDDDILLGVSGNGVKRKGLPAPEGGQKSDQALSEDGHSPGKTAADTPNGTLNRGIYENDAPGNSIKVKKTVQSMRPPDPPTKPAKKRQPIVTKSKQQKAKTVVVLQDQERSNGAIGSTKQLGAKRRRGQQASSSPKQVVVVTSRKPRANSTVQETAAVAARRSPRERKQIEFYRNSDWSKRGDHHERALYVEVSAKGIDTQAYSKVNVPPTPRRDLEQPRTAGSVEELGSQDASSIAQEPIPAEDTPLHATDAEAPSNEENDKRNPEVVPEVFSRNIVDPSYVFSDEEDDLPRRKDIRPKQTVEKANSLQSVPAVANNADEVHETQVPVLEELVAVPKPPKRTRRRKSPTKADTSRAGSIELGEDPEEPVRHDEVETPAADSLPMPKTANARHTSPKPGASQPSAIPDPSQDIVAEPDNGSVQPDGFPHTPTHKKPQADKPSPPPSSAARTGILSLVSDDEEDELSFSAGDITSSDARRRSFVLHRSSPTQQPASTPRRASRHGSLLVSSHIKARTPVRASLGSSAGKLLKSGSAGGRYSLPRSVVRLKGSRVSSPSGALLRTPGGTMRRCGEDGFRCDRDFCFTCM